MRQAAVCIFEIIPWGRELVNRKSDRKDGMPGKGSLGPGPKNTEDSTCYFWSDEVK